MSINTCKLSGVFLTKPVIDKVNGYVYQKEEIERHLLKTSQCPITGREMQIEDLFEMKQNEDISLKTEFDSSQKVPVILKRISSEWENIQIYNFHLRKELEDIKKESSHLLYQHESANLVISRLLKEKDEYLNKLNYFKNQIREVNYNANKEIEDEKEFNYMGITEEFSSKISENSSLLAKSRKNKVIPKGFCDEKIIKKFKISANFNVNENEKNNKNINLGFSGIDVHQKNQNLIITSNNNADICINYFNSEEEKFTNFQKVEKVNTKKINFVKFKNTNENLSFISGSNDNTASFFSAQNQDEEFSPLNLNEKNMKNLKIREMYKISNHTSAIVGGDFHPLGDYCLFASKDGYWSLHNLYKGICITKQISENRKEINSFAMHPDGGIFSTGEIGGLMKIWDLGEEKESFTFEAFNKSVDTICFSNNGFHLACGSNFENVIKVYDLRKLNVIHEFNLEKDFDLRKLKYDSTGNYLGYSGRKMGVLNSKNFEQILELDDHKDIIVDFSFSLNSSYIATSSLDKTLKIFSS
jgi:pre-mRNA-processing factor 19